MTLAAALAALTSTFLAMWAIYRYADRKGFNAGWRTYHVTLQIAQELKKQGLIGTVPNDPEDLQ